jgi:hypothetical protein
MMWQCSDFHRYRVVNSDLPRQLTLGTLFSNCNLRSQRTVDFQLFRARNCGRLVVNTLDICQQDQDLCPETASTNPSQRIVIRENIVSRVSKTVEEVEEEILEEGASGSDEDDNWGDLLRRYSVVLV